MLQLSKQNDGHTVSKLTPSVLKSVTVAALTRTTDEMELADVQSDPFVVQIICLLRFPWRLSIWEIKETHKQGEPLSYKASRVHRFHMKESSQRAVYDDCYRKIYRILRPMI